jgi:hypothetical protein
LYFRYPAQYDEIGIIKFNSCYSQFAFAVGGNVYLYNFEPSNGLITLVGTQSIKQAYGLEFSPTGNYLYCQSGQDNNNPGRIWQMAASASALGAPTDRGGTGGSRGGHLQLGPDGNIYIAIPKSFNIGSGSIGVITNSDLANSSINTNLYTSKIVGQWPSTYPGQWVSMDLS